MPASWAAIEKAQTLLGWRPQVRFADGVKQSVEWYLTNRTWAKQISTKD
jgi:dTDP-glucose 4,6-dehydratase